jgi:hypothetical protein
MHTLFALILFLAHPAQAYDESFPEFTTLSELEQAHFDRPTLLGPEYQSDIYAFATPWDWQHAWLANKIAFDTTFGSISPVHFLMDTRAKIHAPLTKGLEFRFLHFDERQHDREAIHTIFELVAWPWQRVGFGAYGEPSYTKRENDVGLAVFYKPGENHEVKAFHTWVDIVRQRRSDRTDTFDRQALPYAWGIVGRWWSNDEKKNFLEYAIRREPRSQWNFPDEQYAYFFWRDLASAFLSMMMDPAWRLNVKLQADKKLEARSRTSLASTASEDAFTTMRYLATVQTPINGIFANGWEFTPTLQYANRKWSTLRDTLVYHDYLVGLLVGAPKWFFDYSATWHKKFGGALIAHPDEKTSSVNHRLDIGYAFVFHPKAELRIRAGFDVDSFGTQNSWESGAAQFRWEL